MNESQENRQLSARDALLRTCIRQHLHHVASHVLIYDTVVAVPFPTENLLQ